MADKASKLVIIAALAGTLFLATCSLGKTKRVIRIVDTTQSCPVPGKFIFYPEPPALYMFIPRRRGEKMHATIGSNGEARAVFPNRKGWARFLENSTNDYGVTLTPENIKEGGVFRLYGSPPVPGDTNIYPSKYVLEVRKP